VKEPSSPGRTIKLRVLWWAMRGTPVAPLFLRTKTGRLYLVVKVRKCRPGSKARYSFDACRIQQDEVPKGVKIHSWAWGKR
jgi:hypothetical protein